MNIGAMLLVHSRIQSFFFPSSSPPLQLLSGLVFIFIFVYFYFFPIHYHLLFARSVHSIVGPSLYYIPSSIVQPKIWRPRSQSNAVIQRNVLRNLSRRRGWFDIMEHLELIVNNNQHALWYKLAWDLTYFVIVQKQKTGFYTWIVKKKKWHNVTF